MFLFFLNDTATTVISTYGHTRSLHAALPIVSPCSVACHATRGLPCRRGISASCRRRNMRSWRIFSTRRRISLPSGSTSTPCGPSPGQRDSMVNCRHPRPCNPWGNVSPWHATTPSPSRSEEHTSELQSLMRTSYDVFCLKKQKRDQKYPSQN